MNKSGGKPSFYAKLCLVSSSAHPAFYKFHLLDAPVLTIYSVYAFTVAAICLLNEATIYGTLVNVNCIGRIYPDDATIGSIGRI